MHNDEVEINDEEIERLAKKRAELEEQLESRKDELDRIGDIGKAYCVEFLEEGDWEKHIVFVFEIPSGQERKKAFGLNNEIGALDRFMDKFGADSLTDMMGAAHDCVYTDNGWKLTPRPSQRHSLYWSHTSQDGGLWRVFWPGFVTMPVVFFGSIIVSDLAGLAAGFIVVPMLASLLTVLLLGYSIHKTEFYV